MAAGPTPTAPEAPPCALAFGMAATAATPPAAAATAATAAASRTAAMPPAEEDPPRPDDNGTRESGAYAELLVLAGKERRIG
mmetsp:Transcript_121223/g.343041  ORF Transcript_121223/g.343041 Transcript_121223/m.343041 type:complete len:82 (-) Transcript_121223:1633-1878(-)